MDLLRVLLLVLLLILTLFSLLTFLSLLSIGFSSAKLMLHVAKTTKISKSIKILCEFLAKFCIILSLLMITLK